MKKVLILNLSCDDAPYDVMITTAQKTWDSIEIPYCETIYYCGRGKPSTDKIIRLPIKDSLRNMGEKTLQAFEWALKNKDFDYIARVHSSCYVDKKRLMEYVQELPYNNIFSGVEATSQNGFQYLWGGCHFVISKDVVQKIVNNKYYWNHSWMEDESMSVLCTSLGIPFHAGKSCSINKRENDWLLLAYGGESKEFSNFAELKDCGQHFYRCKQDGKRDVDEWIMNELFKVLKLWN